MRVVTLATNLSGTQTSAAVSIADVNSKRVPTRAGDIPPTVTLVAHHATAVNTSGAIQGSIDGLAWWQIDTFTLSATATPAAASKAIASSLTIAPWIRIALATGVGNHNFYLVF